MTSHETTNPPTSMRPFMTLWVGQVFSLIGSQLVQFALIWWLTEQTGSATVLAFASIAGLLPQVVLGPFVGPLIDRWNRKRTMILADLLVSLVTVVLIVLFQAGMVESWHVLLTLFIRSLGGAFHWPAMTASTSLMVPVEQLTRVQGLNQMVRGGMGIATAPLGALLITLFPMQSVLMIDVVTATIAIVLVLLVHIPQPTRQAAEGPQSATSAYFQDLREGLRYVFNWRGLLIVCAMAMLVNLVIGPSMSFLPLLVTDHFSGSAWQLGIIQAGFSVGALAGGVLLSIWGGFRRRIYTTLFGLIGIGAGIFVIGITPSTLFSLAVAGMLTAGLMGVLCDGPIMAIFQASVEPSLQGRVLTLVGSASAAMMPLGLAVAGPLADIVGVRTWFLAGGLITIVVGLAGFFMPSVINIESDRAAYNKVAAEPATIKPALDAPETI